MRLTTDPGKCIASGTCVFICPQVFAQDDDGIVVLLQAEPPDSFAALIEEAVGACPVACLSASTA